MKTVMGLWREIRGETTRRYVEEVLRGKKREKDSQGQLETDRDGEGANEGWIETARGFARA
jgi:hypothetical protein